MTIAQIPLNDGHTIPQLGFGVFKIDDAEVGGVLENAFATGFRHIDTAALYRNEKGVGEAIQRSGIPREQLFITTKLWNDRQADADVAFKESLEKLGLDYVDLYLIHWPSPKYGRIYLQAWEQMIKLREEGLIRSIGVSNFTIEDLQNISENSPVVPAVNQVECHPTLSQVPLRAEAAKRGIVTESWSPLGQAQELEDPTVQQIAEEIDATPAQVILAWHLANGLVVIPKSSNPDRMRQNFEAQNLQLSNEQLAKLDGLNRDNRVGPDPATADF